MKTVMVISFSDISRDPRVTRQILALIANYNVIAVGFNKLSIPNVQFIRVEIKSKNLAGKIVSLTQMMITRNYEGYYWRMGFIVDCLNKLKGIKKDIVIANDIDTLPLALKISNGAKVIFDAHEYSPEEFDDMFIWKVLFKRYKTHFCQKYIPEADAMITVCDSIAERYEKDTGVKAYVINNAVFYQDIEPVILTGRDNKVRLVHHGIPIPSRKIENMIQVMDFLDQRFELYLMLTKGPKRYLNKLKKLASNYKNIFFVDPVPMPEIAAHINQYDIGFFLLEPTNFNYYFALPNKLFEFVQGRLAVAVSPSPEMAKVVKQYDLGVVADDFTPEAMAKKLMALDNEKINYYKKQSHKAAKILNAENNNKLFLEIVESVIQS